LPSKSVNGFNTLSPFSLSYANTPETAKSFHSSLVFSENFLLPSSNVVAFNSSQEEILSKVILAASREY